MSNIDDGPLHGRVGERDRAHQQLRVGQFGVVVHFDPRGASAPTYQTQLAAGADLRASERIAILPGMRATIRTGLRIALPAGMEAQVRPRSGLSRMGIDGVLGTIDADYRGEIAVILINNSGEPFAVIPGDRIAQLVIAPVVRATFVPVEALDETERGAGGFGSTGVR